MESRARNELGRKTKRGVRKKWRGRAREEHGRKWGERGEEGSERQLKELGEVERMGWEG